VDAVPVGATRELIARVDENLQLARLRREFGESERRYREVQMELAHANRVATSARLPSLMIASNVCRTSSRFGG
jgi:hypothetical protein